MADVEQALADCVGAVYEAAAGGDGWFGVGERMRQLLDARSAALYLPNGATGKARNLLMPPDPAEALYAAHYHALNPYARSSETRFRQRAPSPCRRSESRRRKSCRKVLFWKANITSTSPDIMSDDT
jgi:hypothetical protein